MAKFGREVFVRTLSGLGLLIVVVAAVLFSGYTFAALMAVIGVGSMWEFYRLGAAAGASPQRWYCVFIGALTIVGGFLSASGIMPAVWMAALVPLIAAVFVAELYRRRGNPLVNVSVSLAGLIYAALPMTLISFIAYGDGEYNPYIILAYIFTVWVNDIFAYLTGIAFGRHRLFERISPKKSWEGFFGGLVFSAVFTMLCGHLLGGNLLIWMGFGLIVVISGVFGDLVESMFKRAGGVKDSGKIMPGHGGFMDRFDALLLSAPFIYCYFLIFGL